ncbi:MAG: PH domain-containing protein [Candidatus Nanopelagicales bacterium]
MGYPQKLLSDGESVVFEMRPHWRALVVPAIVLLAVIFGLFFLLRTFAGDITVLSWVTWVVALFLIIVFAVRPFLYWVTTQYVFTNRRIIVRSGLIARHGRDMPLSKVNNVSFDVSAAGRILNYGTLTIDSASDEALIINDVPNVEDIQREVNRLHEEDDERRRRSVVEDYTKDIRPEQGGGSPS